MLKYLPTEWTAFAYDLEYPGSAEDKFFYYLRSLGYNGSVDDMLYSALRDNGYSLSDINSLSPEDVLFNITSFYEGITVGSFLNPSDLSSMFTTSAGTTPVTSVNDPIGLIRDKSGNGNDVTASGTSRPSFVRSSKNAILSDGINDSLMFSAPSLYSAGEATIIIALKAAPQSGTRFLQEFNSGSAAPLYMLAAGSSNTGRARLLIRNDANTTLLNEETTVDVFDNTWHILTVIDDGASVSYRVDGADAGGTTYTRSGTLTLDTAAICGSGNLNNVWGGYTGPMMTIGAVLTEDEIEEIEAFIAAKVA